MHMTVCYPTGRRAEAILLAATSDRMRVIVRNSSDTLELRRADGRWISDTGAGIEIESLIASGPIAMENVWSEMSPRVKAATS